MRIELFSRLQLVKTALIGAALLAATFACAQDNQSEFASQTPLKLNGEGPWFRIELPLTVQLNSRQSDLGDLRVFNAEGQAQAYAVAYNPVQQRQVQAPIPVKWFPLYSNADATDAVPAVRVERTASGTVIEVQPQSDIEAGEEILRGWLLDTSDIKEPLEQLTIDWNTEREGFQRFSIEASNDLQNWRAWGEGQVARLSFADELVEQRDVALPGRSARYLRLLWKAPQGAPALTSAQLTSVSTDNPALPLSWSQAVSGSVTQPGTYQWELPTGLPLERLKIDIAQANSLAPGSLYGRLDSKDPWQPIASGLLYRLTQNGEDIIQDELQLPGKVVRQLKLEVDERGGGLGAQAPQLRFAVRATQLVFLARGNGPFSLATGNPAAKAANLPLATLIPDYSARKIASLGSAEPVTAPVKLAAAPMPVADTIDWKRAGLWSVLVLGVILLGWMALSSLRGANRS